MQAAIDCVIRTFTLKHPASLNEPMSDGQSRAVHDEATAFAAQLLENYKQQLTQRTLTRD